MLIGVEYTFLKSNINSNNKNIDDNDRFIERDVSKS